MKKLQTTEKIVQKMTRDGAVEVNKATGGAARISARASPDATPAAEEDTPMIRGVADRVLSERDAAKKRMVRKANAEIFKSGKYKTETPRLRFTDAERADPAMAKDVRRADTATNRYKAARAKIPKEKVLSIERVSDLPNGGSKTRLVFKERDKPPNGKLQHVLDRPWREAALAAHGEVREAEGDNSGVQAAHFTENAAEGAARKIGDGYRHMKLRPYRAAARAEEQAFKANVNSLYQRSLRQNPTLANATPAKKALHKQKIKRQYAKAFRQNNARGAKKAAQTAKRTVVQTVKTVKKSVMFVAVHWKGFAIAGAGLLLLMLLTSGLSSCVAMFGGGFNTVIATSYTAEDTDITGADADYTAYETALQGLIDRIPTDYPGYDEYNYDLDTIAHDPYELASYLTAVYNAYTRAGVQDELAALFAAQYTLTLTPITETRYRTETRTGSYTYTDPETGETTTEEYTYEAEVAYDYYILNVTLVNHTLDSVALSNLTPEQAEMYAVYLETKGNKPELFP